MAGITGALESWDNVQGQERWEGLLIGNGMSIGVWPKFGYSSLYDHAKSQLFDPVDRALFDRTPNFERVLADLNTAMRVNKALAIDAPEVLNRYQSIQKALGRAVNEVHPTRSHIPGPVLAALRRELIRYEWIFTTSYDLVLYWAMGFGENYGRFRDYFWRNQRCEFEVEHAEVGSDHLPVYYMHGALHLVVGGTGRTWKLRRTDLTLLDQFGHPIEGDERARPLLVTEGTARDKLRAIEGNRYLSHALARFRECDVPLVVFGSSLSEHDAHLLDAIGEHPDRPIAVSMRRGEEEVLTTKQAEIVGRLSSKKVTFFDSETHPLGRLPQPATAT